MIKVILAVLFGIIVGVPIASKGIPALRADGQALHKCAVEVGAQK